MPSLGSTEMIPITFGLTTAQRQIDRDFGGPQGLGETRQGMVERIAQQRIDGVDLSGGSRRPSLPGLECHRRVDDLQHAEELEAEFVANVSGDAKHAIAIFTQRARVPTPTIAPKTKRQRENQAALGIAGI